MNSLKRIAATLVMAMITVFAQAQDADANNDDRKISKLEKE